MLFPNVHAVDAKGLTALHHAVLHGDLRQLMDIVKAGADPDACTSLGSNPLHLAARGGRSDLIPYYPYLITATNLDRTNKQGYTPLHEALLRKRWWPANVLIAAGASYGPGPSDTPSLSSLATPSDLPPDPGLVLKAMLADPSPAGLVAQALRWRDPGGRTALHLYASRPGSAQAVENLVQAGADPAAVCAQGATPLYLAAAAGHVELVQHLATPDTINLDPQSPRYPGTPLSAAAGRGHKDMVVALLAAGAEPDLPQDELVSPLAVAVNCGHTEVARVLVRALASKHLPQQQQATQQQQQGQHIQEQQQQQGQQGSLLGAGAAPAQQGQAVVVRHVMGAMIHPTLSLDLGYTHHGSDLLEVVLDELGPEVAGIVCNKVQLWHLEWPRGQRVPGWAGFPAMRPFWMVYESDARIGGQLAEGLLLGWMGAEGRRRIPARLQRLVPGVSGAQQQQGQQQQQQQGHTQQEQQQHAQPQQLVQEAILAAIHGQKLQAAALMGCFSELWLQQSSQGGAGVGRADLQAPHAPAGSSLPAQVGPDPVPPQPTAAPPRLPGELPGATPLVRTLNAGLLAAASTHRQKQEAGVAGMSIAEYAAHWSTAGQVEGAFLAGWVAARGGPQCELVRTVVAAVRAAHQPLPEPPVPAAVPMPSWGLLAAAAQSRRLWASVAPTTGCPIS